MYESKILFQSNPMFLEWKMKKKIVCFK